MPDLFEALLSPLIVLDLEWNQHYGRQRGIPSSLAQEIVEIGAVKLDASLQIVDQFMASVRPVVHPVLHRHVERVTGLSSEEVRDGMSFRQAGEALIEFCGQHFTLCTWGPDDSPVMQRNLAYWSLPQGWLPPPLDAQRMYSHLLCAGKGQQVGLQTAMDALGIPSEFPSHRALNDAYHTALVVQRLFAIAGDLLADDPRVKTLRDARAEHARCLQEQSTVRFTSHRTAEALLADEALFVVACPRCGAPLRLASGRLLSAGNQALEQYAACECHSNVRARFVPQRTASGALSLRVCATPATDQQLKLFQERFTKQTVQRKRRRRYLSDASARRGAPVVADPGAHKHRKKPEE